MKSQNTKSSDELKKEVQDDLHNVRNDIDKMQDRFTPGQFIDEAIFSMGERSPGAIVNHFKRNPVGSAFLTLGTLLLMEDENHISFEEKGMRKFGEFKEDIKSQMPHKEFTPGEVPNRMDLAREKLHEATGKLGFAREKIRSAAKEKLHHAKDRISSMKESLQSRSEYFDESFIATKERVSNLDPLTYMALGAGLGAITGAALPISEKESQFVGEKLRGNLSGFNEDLQNAINESANILKDLVIDDAKKFKVNVFHS